MSPLAAGAARGAVAAMAMTGARRVSRGLGLVAATPPEELVREGAPRLVERLPPERRAAAVELVHWAVGAGGGAIFGLLPHPVRRRRAAGPLYGLAVLAAFESIVRPMLDGPRSRRAAVRERLALAADHVLYGLVLGDRLPPPR